MTLDYLALYSLIAALGSLYAHLYAVPTWRALVMGALWPLTLLAVLSLWFAADEGSSDANATQGRRGRPTP